MYEIDKEAFSAFLTELRKEKGWTQKDLAEKVLVSDKAVSKWERALSLPDISLLIPLAEALGVTVTELLEGKRMENPTPMEAEDVELLVKKALSLSEENPEQAQDRKKRHLLIFAAAAITGLLEFLVGTWLLSLAGLQQSGITLLVLEAQGVGFGLYFWVFMGEKLPAYYDENRIAFYYDGFLKLNLPGVSFNNSNWPHIVKALRIWSIVTMVTIPLVNILFAVLTLEEGTALVCQMVVLVLYLAGLFLPVYLVARKKDTNKQPMEKRQKAALIVLAVLIPVLLVLPGKETSFNTLQIGYVSNTGIRDWSAHYSYFSGTKTRTIYPEDRDYMIQIETKGGSLSVDIQDGDGVVFSQTDIQTGTYPVTLDSKAEVTLKADGHKGSFSIIPMQ